MKRLLLSSITLITATLAIAENSAVPNPASQNCLALGGELEPFVESTGAGTNCVIEEWLLYHQMKINGLGRTDEVAVPNPASENCTDIRGTLRTQESAAGQTTYCVVDQWTLFSVIDVVTGRCPAEEIWDWEYTLYVDRKDIPPPVECP